MSLNRKSEIQSIAKPEILKQNQKQSVAPKKRNHKSHTHHHTADKVVHKKQHPLDLNTLQVFAFRLMRGVWQLRAKMVLSGFSDWTMHQAKASSFTESTCQHGQSYISCFR